MSLKQIYNAQYLHNERFQNSCVNAEQTIAILNDLYNSPNPTYEGLEIIIKKMDNDIATVSSRGVLNKTEWENLKKNVAAKRMVKAIRDLQPTNNSYNEFFAWFHQNLLDPNHPEIVYKQHHLVVNRIFATRFPEILSSNCNIRTFPEIESFIMKQEYGVHFENNNGLTWLERNINLLNVIKHRVFGNGPVPDGMVVNHFVWFLYLRSRGEI